MSTLLHIIAMRFRQSDEELSSSDTRAQSPQADSERQVKMTQSNHDHLAQKVRIRGLRQDLGRSSCTRSSGGSRASGWCQQLDLTGSSPVSPSPEPTPPFGPRPDRTSGCLTKRRADVTIASPRSPNSAAAAAISASCSSSISNGVPVETGKGIGGRSRPNSLSRKAREESGA
jgi:hypothetical protein